MYHFNENNIVTGYIKELLHNFELPTCSVFINGKTEVYPNTNYIYNHSLILTGPEIEANTYTLKDEDYTYVQSYTYGQSLLNLTKHLKLNSILYNTYTHEYLGDYLRFYRDYTGIDLMMLYNCFSNRMAENFYAVSGVSGATFNAADTDYKIYLVPVKFNQKYLVGIDSDVEVELVCGLVDNNVQVTQVDTSPLFEASYQKYSSMSFQRPIVFDTHFGSNLDAELKGMERCLKLCIKVPATNRSSISVVETLCGPEYFTQAPDGTVASLDFAMATVKKDESISQATYPSKLSLFKINDGVSYPFADRLLEFLFGQAITSDEIIGENIERVRVQLADSSQRIKNGVQLGSDTGGYLGQDGVWNRYIRPICYKAAIQPHTSENVAFNKKVFDLTYYIDKDIESLISVVPEV